MKKSDRKLVQARRPGASVVLNEECRRRRSHLLEVPADFDLALPEGGKFLEQRLRHV